MAIRPLERVAAGEGARRTRGYHAFISYSRAVDGKLAPALQRGLQRFAKPWYRLRALRIFRDDASLSANPDLWGSISDALDGSDYFILLASPESAESVWVAKEAEYWLEHRGTDRLLIVLTDGELVWDDDTVDWSKTSALPSVVGEAFDEEPRYVDFRWARSNASIAPRDARFREAIADLAAPLHGRSKDELLGEDVRQHKRTLTIAWTAASLLALLAAGASIAALLAVQQRDRARTEAQTALSRQLAAESNARLDGSSSVASLLALESYRLVRGDPSRRGFDARNAMLFALARYGRLTATLPQTGVAAAAFTPDGRTLITGDSDGAVRFWSPAGKPLSPPLPTGGRLAVKSIAVSRDGRRAAVSLTDGTLELWSVPDHTRLGPLLQKGVKGSAYDAAVSDAGANALAFSRDGALLASAGADSWVGLWDVRARKRLFRVGGPATEALNVAFGRDGSTLISTDGDAITKVWSVPTGHLLKTIRHGGFRPLGFTEDGRRLVSMYDGLGLAGTLDRTREKPLSNSFALHATVSRDGATLADSVPDAIEVWDLRRRTRFATLPLGSQEEIAGLEISPDGRLLASIATDGTARLWDVSRAEPLSTALPSTGAGPAIAFNQDGTIFATGGKNAVVLRDARDGHELGSRPIAAGYVTSTAFGPDGTIAVGVDDGAAILFSSDGGIRGKVQVEPPARIIGLTFSTDGKRLALAPWDGRLQWFDMQRLRAEGDPSRVTAPTCRTVGLSTSRYETCHEQIARSPDGSKAAVYAGGGVIRLWNVVRQEQLGQLRTDGLNTTAAAFSPDNRLLGSGSTAKTLQLWDVTRQQPLGPPLPTGGSAIVGIAFAPNGQRLAAVAEDGTVRVWSPLLLSTDYAAWRDRLCAIAGRNFTAAE